MHTNAVVFEAPERLAISRLDLVEPQSTDIVVEVEHTGISTGTERLIWAGRMPAFPGFGYPLVPGYESVGRISHAGEQSGRRIGERVFVPGARCFGSVKSLFGGAAARLVVPGARAVPIGETLEDRAILLALAATARHALAQAPRTDSATQALPDLIVGHGVLGRLLARLTVLAGGSPTVWETLAARRSGATGYRVVIPDEDSRRDYRAIYDVSGDPRLLDTLIARLAPAGEIVLAGFYAEPLTFAFAPAFMREARLRVAAEWHEADLIAVRELAETGALSLEGLITHCQPASEAAEAYRTAFADTTCLKMVLDWRERS